MEEAQKRLESELRSVCEQVSRELSTISSAVRYAAPEVDTTEPFIHDRKLVADTDVVPVVRCTYQPLFITRNADKMGKTESTPHIHDPSEDLHKELALQQTRITKLESELPPLRSTCCHRSGGYHL